VLLVLVFAAMRRLVRCRLVLRLCRMLLDMRSHWPRTLRATRVTGRSLRPQFMRLGLNGGGRRRGVGRFDRVRRG
jgi:hypothetical protein